MSSGSQKVQNKRFQSPKGTRDFYPQDMAVRRYIEGIWRQTSINHGFDEVEGPMFEDIELYKHKSGPGIVSEIFQVYSGKDEKELASIRGGADAPFALRPEFTPTLARMVAAKAAELPRPIKWFAIPQHFRAERPQRGRLREFVQWNVDVIGSDTSIESRAKADVEVIAIAIAALERLGLTPATVCIQLNNRLVAEAFRRAQGISDLIDEAWFQLIDEYPKIGDQEFLKRAVTLGVPQGLAVAALESLKHNDDDGPDPFVQAVDKFDSYFLEKAERVVTPAVPLIIREVKPVLDGLEQLGLREWWTGNPFLVRGLAYYTGTVFEIHERSGQERAIAGGGRYDNLIESFGGPKLPACGFGMGDVVLANLLHDKGLLPEEVYMEPLRPHAFVIAADDAAAAVGSSRVDLQACKLEYSIVSPK